MTALVTYGAIVVTGVGMMLVVAGVVATGFFLPGVIVIGIGAIGFAAAAVLHAMRPTLPAGHADRARPDHASPDRARP